MAAPLEDGPNTPEETNAILSGLGAKPKAAGTSNPRGFRRQNARKATIAKSKKGLSTGVVKVSDNQELVKPGTVYGTLSHDENGIPEAQRRNPVARINNTLKDQGVGIKVPQVSTKGAKKAKASKALGDEYTDEVGSNGQGDPFQSLTNLANHMQRQINAHREAAGGKFGGDFQNAESILRAVHGHIMSAQGAHNSENRVSVREGGEGYQENYPYKSAHPDDTILRKTYAEGEEIPGEHLTPAQAEGRTPQTAHDHLDMAAKLLGHTGKFLHDLTHHVASMPGAKDIPTFDNNYQGTGRSVGQVANDISDEYLRTGGKSGEKATQGLAGLDTGRVRREDAHTAVYEAPEGRSITDRLFPGSGNRGRDTVMQFALAQAKKHEDAIGWAAKGPGRVHTGTPMGPQLPAPTGSVFAGSDGKAITSRESDGNEPRVVNGVDVTPVGSTRRSPVPEAPKETTMVPYGTNSPKPSNPPKLKSKVARAAAAKAIMDARPSSTTGTQDASPTQSPERTARYNAAWNERALRVKPVAADMPDKKELKETGRSSGSQTRPDTRGYDQQMAAARKAPTRGKAAVTDVDMKYINDALQQGDAGRAAALHWRAANTLPADSPVTSSRRYAESKIADNPKAYLKEAGIKVPKNTGRSRGAFDAARGQ